MTLWMTCDQSRSGNLEWLWIISECALHTHTHTHTQTQNTNKAKRKQKTKTAMCLSHYTFFSLFVVADNWLSPKLSFCNAGLGQCPFSHSALHFVSWAAPLVPMYQSPLWVQLLQTVPQSHSPHGSPKSLCGPAANILRYLHCSILPSSSAFSLDMHIELSFSWNHHGTWVIEKTLNACSSQLIICTETAWG